MLLCDETDVDVGVDKVGSCIVTEAITDGKSNDATMVHTQIHRLEVRLSRAPRSAAKAAPLSNIDTTVT
jgi:hypothetical protein